MDYKDLKDDALALWDSLDKSDYVVFSRVQRLKKCEVLSLGEMYADVTSGDNDGNAYHATIGTCSCVDWTRRKDKEHPCKHQYALMHKAICEAGTDEEKDRYLTEYAAACKLKAPPKPKPNSICFLLSDAEFAAISKHADFVGVSTHQFCKDLVLTWLDKAQDACD